MGSRLARAIFARVWAVMDCVRVAAIVGSMLALAIMDFMLLPATTELMLALAITIFSLASALTILMLVLAIFMLAPAPTEFMLVLTFMDCILPAGVPLAFDGRRTGWRARGRISDF